MHGTFRALRVCPVCSNNIPWHSWDDVTSYRNRKTCSQTCGNSLRTKSPPLPWTPERHQQLENLIEQGLSGSQIGALLGCSRNSIIARCNRTGLKLKGSRSRINAGQFKKQPKKPIIRIEDTQIPQEQRRTLLTLEPGQCHWPVGEPDKPDFFFCGGPIARDSYCAAHYHRAHDYHRAQRLPQAVPVLDREDRRLRSLRAIFGYAQIKRATI